MRKIEAQMIAAVRDCLSDPSFSGQMWRNVNTCVWQMHSGIHGTPSYYRWIEIILHNTAIATIEPTLGRMILDTGGYETATTRSRLNAILREFCPSWHVCQHKHKMFVVDSSYQRHDWHDGKTVGFDAWSPLRRSRFDSAIVSNCDKTLA